MFEETAKNSTVSVLLPRKEGIW